MVQTNQHFNIFKLEKQTLLDLDEILLDLIPNKQLIVDLTDSDDPASRKKEKSINIIKIIL